MSTQPSRSADDGQSAASAEYEGPAEDDRRSFTTGIGSMVDPVVDDPAADAPATDDDDLPPLRPTFTARSNEPATVSPVPEPAPALDDAKESDDEPAPVDTGTPVDPALVDPTLVDPAPAGPIPADTVPESPAVPAPAIEPDDGPASTGAAAPEWDRTQARPVLTPAGLDEPLLSDAAGLRLRWQQVQAGFVDDPQEAVGDAADLIEQSAQALVGALRQRQRELRVLWERGANGGPGSAQTGGVPDTEHLRLMMQRYRALFNQLCRP
jgi:hypothetical protein